MQNTNSAADAAVNTASKTSTLVNASFERLMEDLVSRLPYIIGGLIVLLIFWLAAKIVKRIFLYTSGKTELDKRLRMLISRLLVVAIVIAGLFTALTIMIPRFGFSDLIAGLGFSSFVVGFATKDILNNFFSGVLVLWQEPFKLGDYVMVNDFEGTVEEIGVRATLLRMYDGEQVLMPNGQMYSSALIIRPAGALQRVKVDVVTDYESHVSASKKRILEALAEIDGVLDEPAPSVFLTTLATEGIRFTAYFWVDTDNSSVMQLKDEASTAINRTLRDAGTKLFPPQRLVVAETGSRKPQGTVDEDL